MTIDSPYLPPEELAPPAPKPRAGEHVDDEAWMHAACLTIAETGQKWGEGVHPSPAMQAVYKLSKERDLLRECERELVEALQIICGTERGAEEMRKVAQLMLSKISAKHGR